MKQTMNNNLLRKISLFALRGNKRNNYNLSLGVVQVPSKGPSRFSSTLTKLTPLPSRTSKDGNLSSQASKWESLFRQHLPLEMYSFQPPLLLAQGLYL